MQFSAVHRKVFGEDQRSYWISVVVISIPNGVQAKVPLGYGLVENLNVAEIINILSERWPGL